MFLKTTSVKEGVKSVACDVLMKAGEKVGKMQTACSHQILMCSYTYGYGTLGKKVLQR